MPSRMNCLVTGASGAIGRRLCSILQEHTYEVIAGLRRKAEGPWDRQIHFDLADESVSWSDLQGISCVFHLAGKAHALGEMRQNDSEYHSVNTEGTRKLLVASKRACIRRFVFFSSVKAINEGGDTVFDETAECLPETPYGRSKLEAERLVLEGGYVPEPVVLRLSMVYGPMKKGNLPRMIEAVANRRFLPLPELGNMRSMVHVDDVIQAALLAAERPEVVGKTYIISDSQMYSTRKIYEWICEALGRTVPGWAIPVSVLKILAKAGDGIGLMLGRRFMFDTVAFDKLAGSSVYSCDRITQELGFNPKQDLCSALPEIIAALDLK